MARIVQHRRVNFALNQIKKSKGEGRTKVMLWGHHLGSDLVVYVYNENAHIGAVAVAEYDLHSRRTSTSVITRLGHKDDVIAQQAAYKISKSTKKPVCVIAGIHVDDISQTEINETLKNASSLVKEFINQM